MKTLRQFIAESEEDPTYFHGTADKNAKDIETNGLDPKKSLFNSRIYLTTNHGTAQRYSKTNGVVGSVFMIKKSKLDPNHIKPHGSGVITYSKAIPKEHIKKV